MRHVPKGRPLGLPVPLPLRVHPEIPEGGDIRPSAEGAGESAPDPGRAAREPDRGHLTYTGTLGGATLMEIEFENLEPIIDVVPANMK